MTGRDPLDAQLIELLSSERMPHDAAPSTLAFIHAHGQAGDSSMDTETGRAARALPSPARRSVIATPKRWRFAQLIAACLVLGTLAGGVAYGTETGQVEIDGAATIEIGVNCWGRVVRVSSTDETVAKQLDTLELKGLSCSDALEFIAADADLDQIFAADIPITLTASCGNASQRSALLSDAQGSAKSFSGRTVCSAFDEDMRQKAQDVGMGTARYAIYLRICELEPDITLEECRDLSMRELRQMLYALDTNGQEDSDAETLCSRGEGRGQGWGRGQGTGMGKNARAGTD